jgi:hypothetical protein
MGQKLGFANSANLFDELANVAKRNMANISGDKFCYDILLAPYNWNKKFRNNVPESVILSKVNAIPLKSRVGVTGQREGVTDGLTKSGSERGGNLRKMPLVPERAFPIHWWHQVDLRTKIKMLLETVTSKWCYSTTLKIYD